MKVEQVKVIIWAADIERAIAFYRGVFGAEMVQASEVIKEIRVAGATVGIHGGGEGKRTWTGMSFQVSDVVAGAREVVAAGGGLTQEPAEEDGQPPHLAMCFDTEGNEFMLTRPRDGAARKKLDSNQGLVSS
jgi:predicted enzyme related to lactoylglutathione lyase